jgi:hypothetical protein
MFMGYIIAARPRPEFVGRPAGKLSFLRFNRQHWRSDMRIGAALALIAVGAILRFALTISVTHGLQLNIIGDILMGVGLLGLILWLVMWAPWAQGRRTTYRQTTAVDGRPYPQPGRAPGRAQGRTPGGPGTYTRDEVTYEDDYPR